MDYKTMERMTLPPRAFVTAAMISALMWAGIGYAAGVRPIRKGAHLAYHQIRHLSRRSGVMDLLD